MLRGVAFLTALIGSAPAWAQETADEDLAFARAFYQQGRWAEALPVVDEVLSRSGLSTQQRVTAMELRAFCLYLTGLHTAAEKSWRELLALKPDHKLDEVETSPQLTAFFRRIEPAVPPPEPAAATPPPAATTPSPVAITQDAEPQAYASARRPCGVVLCLMPFGVGQFANGKPLKGTLFAVLETASLATNVALYQLRWSSYNDRGYLDLEREDRTYTLQLAALGMFAATAAIAVVDAFVFAN